MSIPLDVLVKWSRPGKSENSKNTYEAMKRVLNNRLGSGYDVFLQGSYHNNTHVKDNSDIDVVVVDKNIIITNNFLNILGSLDKLKNFKNSLFNSINNASNFNFSLGNKTIKYDGNINYVPVDIVPCGYYNTSWDKNTLGTILYDSKLGKYFINYPKQHYQNGANKNELTKQNFKKTVRMFKNARNHLANKGLIANENIAPSYFLECLVYNVPNTLFNDNEQDTFYNVISWMYNNRYGISVLKCQNGIQDLFGNMDNGPIIYNKWNANNARLFIEKLAYLWDNWGAL